MGLTENGSHAFVQATGTDGREKHIYKVEIATGKTTQVTTVNGNHSAQFSSTGNYVLDSYSNTTTPKVVQVIETSSLKKEVLKTAENPIEDYQMATMELGELTAKSGEKLYSRMFKPADFDASKKIPCINLCLWRSSCTNDYKQLGWWSKYVDALDGKSRIHCLHS